MKASMKHYITIILLAAMMACSPSQSEIKADNSQNKDSVKLSEQNSDLPVLNAKVIHVVVALCDNKYQAIAPVPAKIGNGQDAANNLYWGAAYGVKTFMKKQPQWQLVSTTNNPVAPILERLIFKHKHKNVYLVADAYDGQYIKEATQDFLDFSAGAHAKNIPFEKQALAGGGQANLVVYIGHNLLMEYLITEGPKPPVVNELMRTENIKRQAAVFACQSKRYFSEPIQKTGTRPLITTTTNMAPEAYSLNALVNGWVEGKTSQQIHEDIAQAYHKYQKSGINGARKLFAVQ